MSRPTQGPLPQPCKLLCHVYTLYRPQPLLHIPRRDKYEKDKIEFWVEEETKGSYKLSHTEDWTDTREVDATDNADPADASQGSGTEDDESEDDGDDDHESESSDNSDSTSHAKKRRKIQRKKQEG